MAKISGYVRDIKVDIGDRVHTGQLLATLEIPEMEDDLAKASATIDEATAELATARDELTRAESARDIAHLSYNRILDVAKREAGLVPQQEVDEAQARDQIAAAAASSAKSKIATSEQHIKVAKAEQARIKTLQQYTVITAPFDGVITKRYANVGSMIQAGTASQTQAMPVVRLSENGRLRLTLPVPEPSVASIHLGQTATVTVSALHKTLTGRITRFAEKVQMATRTMDTEIDVANPGLALIPGMYAQVDLTLEKHPRALTVPLDAVDGPAGTAQKVYLIRDGVIHAVPVTTGLETAQRVEITSGLDEGDDVAVGRHADLADGQQARARLIDSPDAGKGR